MACADKKTMLDRVKSLTLRRLSDRLMAATVQQIAVQTAILEMSPKPSIPNAFGIEEMIKPPADNPTKNMKFVM